MAITQNTYTGNGSTVLYSFSFPYLETTDVKVSLNGTVTTAYTFANATTIQFNTAPANGAAIRIYRETDDTALQAVLSPGSSIRASDLNDNFDQLIYLGQEANTEADSATATANTALTNSATAISTANTASTNASAAVSTANTASANASAAVSTANTASTNASTAVSTANTASTNASTALSTANAATTTANNAVTTANTASSTANTALTNANAAVSTANTASTNASNAVTTANTASANASSAVTTANNAVTTANSAVITAGSAVTTANSAVTTANAAAAAVANAVLYTTVANVAAIPASPANNAAVEVTNSTGIESFTPLSGLPAGFVGSSGLSVRIIYQTVGSTWTWIQYFPNDPENRYFKLSGGTITGPITVPQGTVSSPGVKFSGTGNDNTGVYSPGIDELGLVTNGTARLTIDSAGAVAIPGTLGVTGAITGSLTGAASSNVLKAGDTMTGALVHPLGAAATPSITFTGDTNTGIYSSGADQVAISTNGSGRLFIGSSGSISVGPTNAPDSVSQLTINSDSSTQFGLSLSNSLNTGANTYLAVRYRNGGTHIGGIEWSAIDTSLIRHASLNGITFNTGAATSGSERLRITSTGALNFVGAGTAGSTQAVSFNGSAPVNSLVIDSTGKVGLGISSFNTGLLLQTAGGTSNGIGFLTSGTASVVWRLVQQGANDGSAGILHGSSSARDFYIKSDGGGSANLLVDGKLGIGVTTVNSNAKLHTNGQIYINSDTEYLRFVNAADSTYQGRIALQSGDIELNCIQNNALRFATNNTERARIDSSGRLLVGTSSSVGGESFQINNGTTANTVGLYNGTSGTAGAGTTINFRTDGGATGAIKASISGQNDSTFSYTGRLVFSTSDSSGSLTERMRIRNTGQLWFNQTANIAGIGDGCMAQFTGTGSDWALAIENTNASPYGINIRLTTDVNGIGNEFIAGRGSNTVRFAFRSNGGLANYSANNVNLSDRNVKKDINPAAGTWDCLKEWEIVNFRYKDQPDDADLNMGVIAQQVAESCPEVITVFEQATEDQPEKLGVKEQQMVWMAIKALQEAQLRIEALEAKVAAFEAS